MEEAQDVDAQARELDEDSQPAKRPRPSVSRRRSVASSSSLSSQAEPDDGSGRLLQSRPRSGRGGSRDANAAPDLANSSSGSVRVYRRGCEASEASPPAPFGATVSKFLVALSVLIGSPHVFVVFVTYCISNFGQSKTQYCLHFGVCRPIHAAHRRGVDCGWAGKCLAGFFE